MDVRTSAGRVLRLPAKLVDLAKVRTQVPDGLAQEFAPARHHGWVEILHRVSQPVDHTFHGLLMVLAYPVVSQKQIWHVIRLYHRVLVVQRQRGHR